MPWADPLYKGEKRKKEEKDGNGAEDEIWVIENEVADLHTQGLLHHQRSLHKQIASAIGVQKHMSGPHGGPKDRCLHGAAHRPTLQTPKIVHKHGSASTASSSKPLPSTEVAYILPCKA